MKEITVDEGWAKATKLRIIVIYWFSLLLIVGYKLVENDFSHSMVFTACITILIISFVYKFFMVNILFTKINKWSVLVKSDNSVILNLGFSPREVKSSSPDGEIIIDAGKYWGFKGSKSKVVKAAFPNLLQMANNA